MKITEVRATNLEIPYAVEYRPAWQPGLVRRSRDFTLVRVATESGLGLAGTLHLVCSLPGETWLEMMYEPPTRTIEAYQQLGGILTSRIWIDADGCVHPPEAPGLGVQVNEAAIAQYAV
jgi:L-alanine-DL-glutamate epimerase-like enolase superfamily enzyme